MRQTFQCLSCGDIDSGLVCYEPTGSVCTLCGTVVQECPWDTCGHSTDEYTRVPGHILRVFEDLEVEPMSEWWSVVQRQVQTTSVRVQDALSVLATHHPRFASGSTVLFDYAKTHHGITPDQLVVYHNEPEDIYTPLLVRLAEMIPMSHPERRMLRCQIADAVSRVPQLELRMPNAVVLAVYLKGTRNPPFPMVDVCRWMKISTTTVRKTMTLI